MLEEGRKHDGDDLTNRARALREEIMNRYEGDPSIEELLSTRARVEGFLADQGHLGSPLAVRRLRRRWRSKGPEIEWRITDITDHKKQAELYGLLRLVRVEVLELRQTTARIRSGKAPLAELAAFTTSHAGLESVDSLLAKAAKLVEVETSVQRYAEDVCHLRHAWDQIHQAIKTLVAGAQGPAEQKLQALETIDTISRDMVFIIGWRTIPERLRHWLDNTWAGSYVSFHHAFEDEVPDLADRERILELLASQPGRTPGGLVDPKTGVVYRYSKSNAWRTASVIALIGAMLGLTAGVPLAAKYLAMVPDQLKPGIMLVSWLALVLGVLFHTAADAFKRDQAAGKPGGGAITVAHPTRWANARFWHLALRILTMVIGFVGGIALYYKSQPQAIIVSMLLVGYGLDSFVGIFTQSVEQRASAQAAAAKLALGGSTH